LTDVKETTISNRSPSSRSKQHILPSAFEAKEATDFPGDEAQQHETPNQTSTSEHHRGEEELERTTPWLDEDESSGSNAKLARMCFW
jgi:hypothetical protein